MHEDLRFSRRSSLKSLGAMGAAALLGSGGARLTAAEPPAQPTDLRKTIFERVWATPLVDTHEHLGEEHDRLGPGDFTCLISGHYLNSDLIAAGMPGEAQNRFRDGGVSIQEKWKLIEPYWLGVKNTGYGMSTRITLRDLYGVDDLSAGTLDKIQAGYDNLRRPGFYKKVLNEIGNIPSCQVNSPTFRESRQPTLLMQDISIVGMFAAPGMKDFSGPAGIEPAELTDWHQVIDWWFDKYAAYAVAVKSQDAYRRNIDYEQVPAEQVADSFKAVMAGQPLDPAQRKALEDHLFWYAVRKATSCNLPVKLHTGYYAGQNYMPLGRLLGNAGSACDLCRAAPDARFVFMHICYPYYEELLAVAKQYTNAYIDMCWAWIINPVAAKDFLKKYLVTAPANKIVTFGGDVFFVEQVLGHAVLARRGIALALCELVEEGWISTADAMELIDPIMHGNARAIFNLDEKEKRLGAATW